MRVFDNPNHPQYGPVRRLWVVLVQLDLLTAAERWSDYQVEHGHGWRWDGWLASFVEVNPTVNESRFQRMLIGALLEGWMT